METPLVDGVLFVLARLLEFFGIGILFLFAVRGVAARYIYLVLFMILTSLSSFVLSLFFKGSTLKLSFLVTVLTFLGILIIALYAIRSATVEINIPDGYRCPVCSAFVKLVDNIVALKAGHLFLFFDSKEHLMKFLKAPEEYAKIRKINLMSEAFEEIYIYTDGKWLRVKNFEA